MELEHIPLNSLVNILVALHYSYMELEHSFNSVSLMSVGKLHYSYMELELASNVCESILNIFHYIIPIWNWSVSCF